MVVISLVRVHHPDDSVAFVRDVYMPAASTATPVGQFLALRAAETPVHR
jgi:hypothetical protein